MGKSRWHKDSRPVILGQKHRVPLAKRWRIPPNVYNRIEGTSAGTANQFRAGVWRTLKVKTSNDTCVRGREKELTPYRGHAAGSTNGAIEQLAEASPTIRVLNGR
jgi:hypothetical protein